MDLNSEQREFVRVFLGHDHFQSLPLAGDASTRRYYRIVSEPSTYVLMVWEPFSDLDNFPFVSVQRLFLKNSVKVPEILAVSSALGLILLEDLGDLTLERKFWENQDQRMALPFYQLALDELIKIHYRASQEANRSCTAFQISFNHERLLWELNYGRKHLLEGVCKIQFSAVESKWLDGVFDGICKILDAEPKYIAHRDYHSRNIMIKFGQTRIIDFQDARLGPVQYDLVSLFCDSYVDLKPELVRQLSQYYIDKSKEFISTAVSSEHFDRVFLIQTLQRCFKACGSFASFFNMREDRRYLKYLAPTLRRITTVARDLKEFSSFGAFLKDKGVLDVEFEKL